MSISNDEAAQMMGGFIIEAEEETRRTRARVYGADAVLDILEAHGRTLDRACSWKSEAKIGFFSPTSKDNADEYPS